MPAPLHIARDIDTVPCCVLEDHKRGIVYIGHPAGPYHPNVRLTSVRYAARGGWRISLNFPQSPDPTIEENAS